MNIKVKYVAIAFVAFFLVFNISTSINSNKNANSDLSLSGLAAMAQSGGEEGGAANAQCTEACWTTSCSISGYYGNGCIAGGCGDQCRCRGIDEDGNVVKETSEICQPPV